MNCRFDIPFQDVRGLSLAILVCNPLTSPSYSRERELQVVTKRKSETPQYTMVGNAVPPLMAKAIANKILEVII